MASTGYGLGAGAYKSGVHGRPVTPQVEKLIQEGGKSVNANTTFSPRGSSLANSVAPPGSFSSNLKSTAGYRLLQSRPDLSTYASREDVRAAESTESEQRQTLYREKLLVELKIKTGSENLLEALLSKNSKQAKDQRLKVETELTSSNRKIAELKQQLEQEIERSKRPTTPEQLRPPSSFRGSPLRSPSKVDHVDEEEDEDEYDPDLESESPSYVLAEILQALEIEGMLPDYYVERANNLVELFKRYPTLKYDLAWSIFGLRMQIMLLSESREVVAASYRVVRHAVADRKSLQTIRGLQTDCLVILSLIKDSKSSIEREQALKFIRSFLDVADGVLELSVGVIRTVAAIAEHNDDRLRNMAILTLAEILVKNPALVASGGGINPLKDVLGEGNYAGSECVVLAMLHVMDSPQTRQQLAFGQELESTFAPFTDPVALPGHEERLKTNGRAIAAILNTWPGLFIMAKRDFSTVRSLLLSLTHPNALAREVVLDLLFDILHIKPPSWTSTFLAGRRLTTYGRVTNLKTKAVNKETRLLENEDDGDRASLVDHYVALTLAILLRCGLLNALSGLIAEAFDTAIKRKATLLLGEVLKLANHSLPNSLSNSLQVMPDLAHSAFNAGDGADWKSTNLVYQVESVNRTLYRSEHSGKGVATAPRPETTKAIKSTDQPRVKMDIDEIQFRSLVVDTQVTNTVNFVKWRWDLIMDIIEGPLLNPRRLEDAIKGTKFLKRLVGLYRPFKYRFSRATNTKPNQRYVRAGCALMKSLLQTTEGVQYLYENKLLRQLAECLAQLDPLSGLTSVDPLFSVKNLSDTMSGGYFAILGALSSNAQGLVMLGRWRMINMFYHIIDLRDRDDLIQLLLGSMDFSLDSHLRVMLSKALTSSPKAIRIFATKLLHKYATQDIQSGQTQENRPDIVYWAIRLLITQLYDPEVEVSEVAVNILQEACDRRQCLEYVVQCRPALDHLGEIGAPLLLRFLSTSMGYQYLNGLDYITQEMDDWYLGRNEKYVKLVEASLTKALFPEQGQAKSIVENASLSQEQGKAPPHFYRELARTTEGCKLLRASGHFRGFVNTIRSSWAEQKDKETILKVKGCLWAVGNVGSMELGAPFIEESDVVPWIIKIVESSGVMTMRGTAFFVLGLISRSLHGAEILTGHGWDVATNYMGQSLGYCLPPSLETIFAMPDAEPSDESPITAKKMEAKENDSKGREPAVSRILSLVVDLGNTVLTNRAAGELRSFRGKRPDLFASIALFQEVMAILERHSFRLLVRRFVLDLFDKDILRQIVLDES